MKMKKFNITFERSLDVTIIAPEDATEAEIRTIADRLADNEYEMNQWDADPWQAHVGRPVEFEVSDADRTLEPHTNSYGYKRRLLPKHSPLAQIDMALSDERDDLVNIYDATWPVLEPKTPEEETP